MKIRTWAVMAGVIAAIVLTFTLTATAQTQTGFTVAANITPTGTGNVAIYRPTPQSSQVWRLLVTSGGTARSQWWDSGTSKNVQGMIDIGVEQHIAVTYDGADLRFYLNGLLFDIMEAPGQTIIPAAEPNSAPSTDFTYLPYAASDSEIAALANTPPPPEQCITIIGFSQVRSQYSEPAFDKTGVQLLIRTGIGDVDHWQDPNFDGWSEPFDFPVEGCGFENTGTIVYVVTGTPRPNWAPAIQAAVDTIWTKFPNAHTLVLQPITGGPDHATCYLPDGTPVRASVNAPVIDVGILEVAQANPDVIAGVSPEVGTCDHFADQRGHLTQAGNAYMAPLLDWSLIR